MLKLVPSEDRLLASPEIFEAPFWGQNGTSKAQKLSVFKAI